MSRPKTTTYIDRHLQLVRVPRPGLGGWATGVRARRCAGTARSARGFTLIELMVVVIIISLLAVIAVPGLSRRMETYQAKQVTEEVATIFREARLRALGRGAAVHVQYDGTEVFTIREAIAGPTQPAGCSQMPESSCFPANRWLGGSTTSRQLKAYDFGASGSYGIQGEYRLGGVDTNGPLSVCFTPMGAAYDTRDGTLNRMTSPVRFRVVRTDGASVRRSVVVTPTGTARVVVW